MALDSPITLTLHRSGGVVMRVEGEIVMHMLIPMFSNNISPIPYNREFFEWLIGDRMENGGKDHGLVERLKRVT